MPRRPGVMGPLMLGAGLGLLAENRARPWHMGPPSIGQGLLGGVGTGLALHGALQPAGPPKEREIHLPGGKSQRQVWNRDTGAWEDQGAPYARFKPTTPTGAKSRQRVAGNEVIFEELNPKTLTWEEKSRGPRWEPEEEAGEPYTPLFPGVDPKRGIEQQAMTYISMIQQKLARGEALTPTEQNLAQLAEWHLTQPRTYWDEKKGRVVTVEPTLPPAYGGLGQAVPAAPGTAVPADVPEIARPSVGMDTGAPKITITDTGQGTEATDLRNVITTGRQSLTKMNELLTKAKGEDIKGFPGGGATGIEGFIKRHGAGIARQLGVPETIATTTASDLAREVEALKFALTPILTNERGRTISDADRARIDRVLGALENPGKDRAEIIESMIRISEWIDEMEARLP